MAESADDSALLQDLKALIAEAEASPEPVQLTDLERKAIVDLRDSFRRLAAENDSFRRLIDEIDLGDKDWVSLVHRFRDANQNLGVVVEFYEYPGPRSDWMCHYTIKSSAGDKPGHPMDRRFPDLDLGFLPMGSNGELKQPSFPRKKDAKRYAAKCCIEFLMREKLMPDDGENVAFPKPKPPPPQPKKRKQVVISASGSPGTKSVIGEAPAEATRTTSNTEQQEKTEPSGGGAPLDVRDEDFSAPDEVVLICRRLGINQPTYRIVETDQGTDFFNGSADFGVDDIQIPDSVGRVTNCYGRRFTKEKIAEQILGHLSKIEAERNAQADDLLSLMAQPRGIES